MESNVDYNLFYCAGAGKIKISKDINYTTENVIGFSFGVEWGRHGYTAGVLSKEEAVKLANFILRTVNLDELVGD